MSEYKPITGELRDAMCEWGWVERDGSIMFTTSPIPTSIDAEQSLAISRSDFDYLCDEIDAIHAGLERENAALVTARELRAENAKLRELVRGLVYATHPADRARLIADAVELGVEVSDD